METGKLQYVFLYLTISRLDLLFGEIYFPVLLIITSKPYSRLFLALAMLEQAAMDPVHFLDTEDYHKNLRHNLKWMTIKGIA